MRIGNVQPGRPEYYDRNPTTKAKVFQQAATGPHGNTTRWTYTVPTGKKAYLQSTLCHIMRDGGATVAQQAGVEIDTTTDDATNGVIAIATIRDIAQGAKDSGTLAGLGLYAAGNVISSQSGDGSPDGTTRIDTGANVVEFDS